MDVRNRSIRGTAFGVLGGFILSVMSCTLFTDPANEERRLGLILGFNVDDPRIVIPDTVQVGAEVVVEVTTYGNSCVRKGETEVHSVGPSVTITLYDYVHTGAHACEDILLSFVHQAVLQFSEAGTASVTIVGGAGGSKQEERVEVTRDIVVLTTGALN